MQLQAAEWEINERSEDFLLRDHELQQAIVWAEKNKKEVSSLEEQFLDACKRLAQHEQEILELKLREEAWKEKQRKEKEQNLKRLVVGLTIGILIMFGLALTAFLQREEIQRQKQSVIDRLLLAQIQLIDLRASKMQFLKFGLSIEAFHRLQDAESYQILWNSTNAFRSQDLRLKAAGPIASICFSADSSILVTATDENIIQTWDTATGSQHIQINPSSRYKTENNIETKVLCSPGEKIISKEQDENGSKIFVWDIKTGTSSLNIALMDDISDFDVSQDGKLLLTGSKDGHIVLWNLNTGQMKDQLMDDSNVEDLIFSPTGKQIASANGQGDILIWNYEDEEVFRIHTGVTGLILLYSPDGQLLVSGGNDGSIVFWEPSSGKKLKTLYLKVEITDIVFSPDGNLLYTASYDGAYKVWDVTKDPMIVISSGIYYGPINSADFSPNSKYIVQGGMSGYANIYGFGSLDRMGQAKTVSIVTQVMGEGQVSQALFSPDGENFVIGTDMGEIILSSMTTNIINHDSKVWNIEFNPKKDLIVTSSTDGMARIWDTRTGQKVFEIVHDNQVLDATFHPDGDLIATSSFDHTVKIAKISEGKEILTIQHNSEVGDIDFSADGELLGFAGWDGIAQIWQLNNSSQFFSISHERKINRILFSPNNQWVTTASDDNTIQVWDLSHQKMLINLRNQSSVKDIAFTSDSRYILAGDIQGNVMIWDVQLGEKVFSTNMGLIPIMKVAISSDDKLIAAGNEAGNVCVWPLFDGEESLCFSAEQAVWDIVFSSNKYIMAGSLDGYVYIYNLVTGKEYLRIGNSGKVLSIDLSTDQRLLAISTTTGSSWFVLWKREDILSEACIRLPRQLSKDEWKEYFGDAKYNPFCSTYLFQKQPKK